MSRSPYLRFNSEAGAAGRRRTTKVENWGKTAKLAKRLKANDLAKTIAQSVNVRVHFYLHSSSFIQMISATDSASSDLYEKMMHSLIKLQSHNQSGCKWSAENAMNAKNASVAATERQRMSCIRYLWAISRRFRSIKLTKRLFSRIVIRKPLKQTFNWRCHDLKHKNGPIPSEEIPSREKLHFRIECRQLMPQIIVRGSENWYIFDSHCEYEIEHLRFSVRPMDVRGNEFAFVRWNHWRNIWNASLSCRPAQIVYCNETCDRYEAFYGILNTELKVEDDGLLSGRECWIATHVRAAIASE